MLGGFQMPTLDSLFKKDAKTITSREPGWLKEAREVRAMRIESRRSRR